MVAYGLICGGKKSVKLRKSPAAKLDTAIVS